MSKAIVINSPILDLPDTILVRIFALITDVVEKLRVECVSKRFRVLARHRYCWTAYSRLELIANCESNSIGKLRIEVNSAKASCVGIRLYYAQKALIPFDVFCDQNLGPQTLFGQALPLRKWPSFVNAVLDRVDVRQIFIHIGPFFRDSMQILREIQTIFQQNSCKIKLSTIEYHRHSSIGDMLFLWCLKNSIQRVQKLVILLEEERDVLSQLPQVAEQIASELSFCTKLRSFSFSSARLNPNSLANALAFKRLQYIHLTNNSSDPQIKTVHVANIVNFASNGTFALVLRNIEGNDGKKLELSDLCRMLNDRAKANLKRLSIFDGFDENYKQLELLPSSFPRLRIFELEAGNPFTGGVERKLLAVLRKYVEGSNQFLTKQEIVIHCVYCANVEKFRFNLEHLCGQLRVAAIFNQNNSFASLTRKNLNIRINGVSETQIFLS